jgi:branched-chain amino acid transport system substrate-binding protein
VARAGKIHISPNAGPSQLAGSQCNRHFFNTAFQNDAVHEATGKVVADAGIRRVWLMAPNYPAGQDALRGFRSAYDASGGEVVDEVYTQLGQLDYAAEIADVQAAKPEAVYFFYPGGMGIAFLKQWAQAGVGENVKLYASAFSVSQDILPAVGDAALGVENAAHWSPDLDAGINRRFVENFTAKYGRLPSLYAAQGYDTALFIDAAAKAAGSKETDALIEAFENAEIEGTRGPIRLNTNHYPIQNFYRREVVKNDQGVLTNRIRGTVYENHEDAFVGECQM